MIVAEKQSLRDVLKSQFGFDSFRPHQENIIQSVLDGKDALAVLPTGGGKSLCFQLPAVIKNKLTLVVSPLIALMKDQVDSLVTNGIPATLINSTLTGNEIHNRMEKLQREEFRLLYVAPERLMMPGFLAECKKWNLGMIAIDEAHCISEWGHDFRPEYRMLSQLRDHFPQLPILALTATATKRVQDDIVKQLKLSSPTKIIASFNRPNLTYRVLPKDRSFHQLLTFLKDRPQESGIIYCLARKTCEDLADRLEMEGIKAKPYHAGLKTEERNQNQEEFLRDQIQVICATIAFGMGVHKSNVRFVVHYNLPRNIESYYQETGRAGRDGLESDCLLLYSIGDATKISRFINEKSNHAEKKNCSKTIRRNNRVRRIVNLQESFPSRLFWGKVAPSPLQRM